MSAKKKSAVKKPKAKPKAVTKRKAKPKAEEPVITEAPKKKYHPGSENLRPAWKKGQSGNPDGGKKHNPELKAIKNLTEKELIEVANMVIKGTMDELLETREDPESTVLQRMLASVAVRVMKKGDMHAMDILLNRMIGKVKDKIDVNNMNSTPARVIVTMPSNGKEAKA